MQLFSGSLFERLEVLVRCRAGWREVGRSLAQVRDRRPRLGRTTIHRNALAARNVA